MKRLIFLTALTAGLALGLVRLAGAFEGCCCCQPWHGMYYSPAVGAPEALVAPPCAHHQVHLNSGTSGTRVTCIHARFKGVDIGPGYYDPRGFYPTPRWPTSTDQLGTYYVHGPCR